MGEHWNGESEKTHDLRVGSLVSEGGLGVVVVRWQQTEMGQKSPKKQNNKWWKSSPSPPAD